MADDSKDAAVAISDEIDAAVDEVMKEVEAEREADTGDDKDDADKDDADKDDDGEDDDGKDDADKDDVDKDDDGKDDDGKDDDDKIDDSHLERAVKAGLTMATARKFGSASLLESMVSRLEEARKVEPDDSKDAGEGEDPLAAIPDLDPEEYDAKLVEGFKAMKDIIREQQGTIAGLRKQEGSSTDDWFDGQKSMLDEAVAKAVKTSPEKWKMIRGKFDVLAAGYLAAGHDMGRNDVFQEAVNITMGDVIAEAAADKKAKQLEQRKKQHINRADANQRKAEGDPLEEVADELDQKYFKK